jgi:hypothetical protein
MGVKTGQWRLKWDSWDERRNTLGWDTKETKAYVSFRHYFMFVCHLHHLGLVQQAPYYKYCIKLRGPFEKFVDSTCYSVSELCGGAVRVSFSKYLPWQPMHFLQRSTHFSKTCCIPLITSKSFALELPFDGWKSPEIAWGRDLDCITYSNGVPPIHFFPARTQNSIQISPPCDFWAFATMKRQLRGKKFLCGQRSAARLRKVGGAL